MSATTGPAGPLAELTARFLEHEGAVVERIGPDALDVLAPAHVRTALGLPELARLGFGADVPEDRERVSLESDFFERLERLLGGGGRRLRVTAPEGPRPPSPDRLLAKTLTLANATYRLIGVERAWTTYVIPTFRYVARSDDRREGLVSFGLNAATSSVLDDPAPLVDAPTLPCEAVAAEVPQVSPESLAEVAARVLPSLIDARLTHFLAGMQRRLQRDAGRLLDYYGRLRGESLAKLDRLEARAGADGAPALLRREGQRLESIVREHRAKVEDLRLRYALTVEVECLQTLEIVAPVHRCRVEIRRRKRKRLLALDANPVTRRLEPPPCDHGHVSEGPLFVCDDALHLVSPSSHADCLACQRPFCRACQPEACPRCGRAR